MPNPGSSATSPEARAALALSMIDGIGCATFHDLIARFGSAQRALDDAERIAARDEALASADGALEDAARRGMKLLTVGTAPYPEKLTELPDVPPVLWAIGHDELLADVPRVAIVGTRRATAYGLRVTRALAGALAQAGVCVVSGMARGIDAAAHRAALEAGGNTIAVLGTGADVAYPTSNASLHAEIAERGLLISEYPPGDRANGGSFPRRNRIIAALSTLTIVIEAGIKSGALITARHAMELGRQVAAVPGCIDQPQAMGTNLLLRDGAQVLCGVEDALALMGLTRAVRAPDLAPGSDEELIWNALHEVCADADELCARTRLPADRCLAAVSRLELAGAVECSMAGEVRRRIG